LESNLKLKSTSIVIGVVGGTGFIGLNLVWHLQKAGVHCRTFSRHGLLLNPGSIKYAQLSKIEHVRGDFSDKTAVDEFVRPCRCVILLVSHLLPSSSAEEIRTVAPWFTAAFGQLLLSCLRHKIEQIIFISSGGTIYGENYTGLPVKEDHPLNAQNAYGSFCALLEQLIHSFHHQHGLSFTILRLGNPYGPLKRPNTNQGVIDHFIRSARARQPFTLFGDGTEVRDYIFIDDISESIARVVCSPAQNNTLNVGTGSGHTTQEVISLVKNQFDLPEVPILLQSRRLGDIGCSILNMEMFEKLYGIRCNTSLKEGLRKYADLEAGLIV